MRLGSLNQGEDAALASTFESAWKQLDSIEDELRKRLAVLDPGSPDSMVDLGALQERLAERSARDELGLDEPIPSRLEEVVQVPNPAAAAGLAVFALGWNGFTLFHAILMIGGMWMAFGPLALLLLFFYAIFFGAGYGLANGAFQASKRVKMRLDGRVMELDWSSGPFGGTRRWELPDGARAQIMKDPMAIKFNNPGRRGSTPPSVVITRPGEKPIVVGSMTTHEEREGLRDRINAALAAAAAADR